MSLRYAYNTNGMGSHRLADVLPMLADHGYDGIALTLDHCHLDPFDVAWERNAESLARDLQRLRLGTVIETGARFLLNPRLKHEPTLVTADAGERTRRIDFLKRAIDIGAILGSEAVSFWAGVPKPEVTKPDAWRWLRQGLGDVVAYAEAKGVTAAVEPEPGMLVETVDDYVALAADFPTLRLALDLGHCLVTGDREPEAAVREFAGRIATVSIEDMKRGEHIHLPFGEGDIDTSACLVALQDIAFGGLVCVELSRDGHRADIMLPKAIRYLKEREHPRAAA